MEKPKSMKIRPYDIADQNAVIALWKACDLVKPQNNPIKDIERKLRVDPDLFLVGTSDTKSNEIIASVMGGYEGHRGWINYLAVMPTNQKQGYGQQIMAAIEIKLNEKGCPKINLQVREGNDQVLAFYRAIGYGHDKVVSLGKRLDID